VQRQGTQAGYAGRGRWRGRKAGYCRSLGQDAGPVVQAVCAGGAWGAHANVASKAASEQQEYAPGYARAAQQ